MRIPWSLAVIAFECLTGVRPFRAATFGELSIAVCSKPIPIASALLPLYQTASTHGSREARIAILLVVSGCGRARRCIDASVRDCWSGRAR